MPAEGALKADKGAAFAGSPLYPNALLEEKLLLLRICCGVAVILTEEDNKDKDEDDNWIIYLI